MIKQDHVIKGLVTITTRAPQGKSSPCQVWHHNSGDIMILVSHMIQEDDVAKGSINFMDGNRLK